MSQGTSQSPCNADDVLEGEWKRERKGREGKGRKKILIWQTPLFEGDSGIVGSSRGN